MESMSSEASSVNPPLLSIRECCPARALKTPACLERYERRFEPIRRQVRAVLELGIHEGESLLMWRNYFPQAIIAGLDLDPPAIEDATGRIRPYRGSQDDLTLLDRIAEECAPEGFDFIIDDCAHVGEIAKRSFWHLFDRRLKSTGVYVIEDWGTGYWQQWQDGRRFAPGSDRVLSKEPRVVEFSSHLIGMPGFVKQLIDECAMTDIQLGGSSYRSPHKLIGRLDIFMGQIFVYPFQECSWLISPPAEP
jgi:hypothetical protein